MNPPLKASYQGGRTKPLKYTETKNWWEKEEEIERKTCMI